MKQRKLTLMLVIMLFVGLALMLSSCGADAHIHTPSSAVRENEIAATCTSVGSYDEVIYCADCDKELSRKAKDIVKLNHTEVIDAAVEATDTTDGLTEGKHCSVCNEVIIAQQIIPALPQGANIYIVSGNTISGLTDYGKVNCDKLNIPREIDGVKINSIGACAFDGCSNIKSVIIPDSVTIIDNYAFRLCTNLVSVTIPDSVTSIGIGAFGACTSLTDIVIPDSVTCINDNVFDSCSGLTNITIPDSVIRIGNSAFANCTNLSSISIPDGVTDIGIWAFSKCTSLSSISIPDSVTCIDTSAFSNCTSLESVAIPNGVTSICDLVFSNCTGLTNITISNSVTDIGIRAFEYCASLVSIELPSGVINIGDQAFRSCETLSSITIPDSVNSIGEDAFYGCTSLEYNEYDNGYYLGNDNNPYLALVMAKKTSITSCEISNTTKIICHDAFKKCTSLSRVNIPNSVKNLGNEAFDGCTSLEYNEYDNAYYLGNEENPYLVLFKAKDKSITSCEISSETRFIYDYAFFDCLSLLSIDIPNGVTKIGSYAFGCCIRLEKVMLPDSIISIEKFAFKKCRKLKEVHITDIAKWFGINFNQDANPLDCAGNLYINGELLTELVIPDNVTDIGPLVLSGSTSLTRVIIPDGVKNVGDCAFYGCTGLTTVIISETVTSIGYAAFSNCTSLTKVYYGGTADEWKNISMPSNNSYLENAECCYYSQTEPTEEGNYWYYDENGEIKIW